MAKNPRATELGGDVLPQRTLSHGAHSLLLMPLLSSQQNPEKLAASKKTPLVARYVHGKIAYVRAEQ